jgi:lipoprotein-anchoring transpeptidase ErfK/SrfK
VVAVVDGATGRDGAAWVLVRLPILPNGSLGWVPRSALSGYGVVHTHLVVDRDRLTATLYDRGRPVFRAPVGVGRPRWPTPPGRFYVRSRLTRFRSAFYGPLAFGTSARSTTLTDWPGGGFIGIHGTDRPDLLPGRVSHGCVRMRNADLLRLARLMPTGTPIAIR